MCAYCSMGDTWFRHDQPWNPQPLPQYVPAPVTPAGEPWNLDKLKDYYDLLKRVKALEDELGCPCEPNKADYLKMFEERIAFLEAESKKRIDAAGDRQTQEPK